PRRAFPLRSPPRRRPGRARVGHDLRVDGWLDAPNIKGPNKGMFVSAERLREAYPRPRPGWWALVGLSLPAPLWVAEPNEYGRTDWVNTGSEAGNPTVACEVYNEAVRMLDARTLENAAKIEANRVSIEEVRAQLRAVDDLLTHHHAEIEANARGLSELRGVVTAETAERKAEDAKLGGRIDTEASTRAAEDGKLGGRIDAEREARESALAELGATVTAEIAARECLEDDYQNHVEVADGHFSELRAGLEAERDERKAEDARLLGRIDAETAARQAFEDTTAVNFEHTDGRIDALGREIEGVNDLLANERTARIAGDNANSAAIEAEAKARESALAELRATVEAEIASGSAAGHGTASLELRRREVLPFDYYVGSVEEWVALQKNTQFVLKEGDIVYNICFPGFVQWDGEAFRTSWGERSMVEPQAEAPVQEQGEETQAASLSHSTPGADMDPRGASGHGGAAVLGLGGLVSGPDFGEAGLLEMIDFADSDYYGDLWPSAEEATCRQPGRQSLFRLRSDNSLWCWDGTGLVKVSDISALAGLREELDETAETLAGLRGTVEELGIDEFGLAGENNNSLEISMGGERLTAAITADPEYGQRVIEAPWSETVVLIANLSGWGVTTLRTSFQRGFSGMISGGSNHIHEVVKCIARRNAYTPPNEKIGDLRSSAAYVEPMIVRYGNVQYLALRFKQSGKFLLEGWLKDCLKEFVMLKVETTGGMPEGVTEEIQFARQSYLDDFNVSVANRLKPAVLTTEDLNRIPPSKTEEDAGVSYYIADSGNECKNKPWRVYGFWLKVEAMISKGVMVVYQTLTTFGNKPTTYRRECQVSIWSEWEEVPNPETEITSIREAVGLGEKPPQVFIERFTSHLSMFKSLRQLAPIYNSATNCFEFNELTDISYADARAIDLMMEPHVYDCYSGGS
ncbi:MAG: hypothetical protein K2N88_01490, partial [Muribaculaceae bacterium]|nr:hypothetical protein [Muribaculaceae bacterium]